MGLQRETVGRGTVAVYVQIVFASILEFVVFHTIPSLMSITGTLIIVGSALFVAVTKNKLDVAPSTDIVELEGGVRHLDEEELPRRLPSKEHSQERILEHDRFNEHGF